MSDLTTYNDAGRYNRGTNYYITAAWGENDIYAMLVPGSIVIGDNRMYTVVTNQTTTTYINQPLSSNTQYHFFTRYDIRNERSSDQVMLCIKNIIVGISNLLVFILNSLSENSLQLLPQKLVNLILCIIICCCLFFIFIYPIFSQISPTVWLDWQWVLLSS